MSSDACFVAGMRVTPLDVPAAVERICADAASSTPRVYALVNAHSSKLRRESPEYGSLLEDSRRVIGLADGASVSAAARLSGCTDVGRSPGPDLLEACCAECARTGVPVFLLGGAPGVAERLAEVLAARHEGLHVAGTATPPYGEWSEAEDGRLVRAVRDSGAKLVWMGVSAPKQEIWAYRHADKVGVPLVCVGAAFDFATGSKPRAPRWMRRAGIEWMHRLMTEPGRLWKRYLVGNWLFVVDVARYGRHAAHPANAAD